MYFRGIIQRIISIFFTDQSMEYVNALHNYRGTLRGYVTKTYLAMVGTSPWL